MGMTGIEQGRAAYAYSYASEGSKLTKKKEYKSYARKIPTLIKTNGLGATLAFIASKKDEDRSKGGYAYKVIYDQISQWLAHKGFLPQQDDDLAFRVSSLDSPAYRAVTGEVLALFKWLTRFAAALIEGEADEK
jgi:CRISPR-associated protein Cmr5